MKKDAVKSRDNLKQYNRRNNLTIFSVKDEKGENINDVATNLLKKQT